jgi:hypothetical protein
MSQADPHQHSLIALLVFEELRILFDKILVFVRQIFLEEDRLHRAFWFASGAINTLRWIDEELIVTFMDTIYGTHFHTGFVFHPNTRFCNYVSHVHPFSMKL